jgi:hypothetical protein
VLLKICSSFCFHFLFLLYSHDNYYFWEVLRLRKNWFLSLEKLPTLGILISKETVVTQESMEWLCSYGVGFLVGCVDSVSSIEEKKKKIEGSFYICSIDIPLFNLY